MSDRNSDADDQAEIWAPPAWDLPTAARSARPARRHRPAAAATAVLAVVVVLAGLVLWLSGGRGVHGQALPSGPIPLGDREVCANVVTIAVTTDEEMAIVAEALRGDHRVLRSYTQTKQEGWEAFQRMFANEPDLMEMAGPEGSPAMVTVVPNDQTGTAAVAGQLRAQFPRAQSVRDGNEFLSRITGPDYRDPTCPPDGERPR